MDNTLTFISVAFIVIIIAIFGIQISMSGNESFLSFTNSTLAMIDGAVVNRNKSPFVSFDNFNNIYPISLSKKYKLKILSVLKGDKNNFWIATNHGLFLSRDGGLTWNNFVSIDNAVSKTSNISAITPLSQSGKDFVIAILKNNVGYVYITHNEFFNLKELLSFNNETPSVLFELKNMLYIGMPNGELIKYNINKKYASMVQSFNSPISEIKISPTNDIYIKLKSGKLFKAKNFLKKFNLVKVPWHNLYSKLTGNTEVKGLDWDKNGNMYILSQNRIFISKNNGGTSTFIKSIPLLGKNIDTMCVHNNSIGVMSENKMLTSSDKGKNWHIRNIDIHSNNVANISNVYFVGGRIFLQ